MECLLDIRKMQPFFYIFNFFKLLNNRNSISNLVKIAYISIWGLSVMFSRWVFKCHTVQQIIIGATLGTFFGYGAFKIKDYVFFVIKKSVF